MDTITFVVITKNEESNIRQCLESIKWADEIIVVDSFSKDQTVKICLNYTKKIYKRQWPGIPARQRYFGCLKAKSKWIFNIDADEVVSSSLKKIIKKILKQGSEYTCFLVRRYNQILGSFWLRYHLDVWGCDYLPRLFNSEYVKVNKNSKAEGLIIKGKTIKIESPLYHYTQRNLNFWFEKINIRSNREAEMKRKRRTVKWYHLLFITPLAFFKSFIIRRGFADGMGGLIFSLNYMLYRTVLYMKIWEYQNIKKYQKKCTEKPIFFKEKDIN